MAGRLFISYRRSDSAAFAGRIADFFAYTQPDVQVFFDVAAIEPGEDFVEAIRKRLVASDVVLAMIGQTWLETRDARGKRRLDNPSDFVRLELSMALAMGKRVIPVLLDAAQMPAEWHLPEDLRALARCNAELVRGAAFQRDAEHLAGFVRQYLETVSAAPAVPAPAPQRQVGSSVKDSLVAAFERFRDEAGPFEYMICSDTADRYVQFVKSGEGQVMLDLPSLALTPGQLAAARRLLEEDYEAGRADLGDGQFTFQLDLPLDPAFLSHFVLGIFEHVYGALPSGPLAIEINN